MKLMPASRALATIRAEVASSAGPPNIMVPKQIGETLRPLRPSWRYCLGGPSDVAGGGAGMITVREGHDDTALHQAAAIVMLVLGDQRKLVFAIDQALPQRPDQVQEAGGVDHLPAVGFELSRGLVDHEALSLRSGFRSFHQWLAWCSQAG